MIRDFGRAAVIVLALLYGMAVVEGYDAVPAAITQ